MFQELDMRFAGGTILTAVMLRELSDYPREVLSIQYERYPDGSILAGTDLTNRADGHVWMGKGLVKYNGIIYRMAEDLDLSEAVGRMIGGGETGGKETKWKLLFSPAETEAVDRRPSQQRMTLRLQVVRASEDVEGVEFARFKLLPSGGLGLSCGQDMEDPANAVFWNMTQCRYARRGEATFHPYVFQALRPVLEKAGRRERWYYTVLEQLSTEGVLSMELIRAVLRDHGVPLDHLDGQPEAQQRSVLLEKLSRLTARPAVTGTGQGGPVEIAVKKPRRSGGLL